MKNLKEIVLSSVLLATTLVGCTNKNVPKKTYMMYDGSFLKVKDEQMLSVYSPETGRLAKINGKLYVICEENGETFLGDFGKNVNPQLVKDSDGTYDVRVKREDQGESYYDWDKSGKLTTTHTVGNVHLQDYK